MNSKEHKKRSQEVIAPQEDVQCMVFCGSQPILDCTTPKVPNVPASSSKDVTDFDGFVTFHDKGFRKAAKITIDQKNAAIMVRLAEPAIIKAGPGLPIIIEGPIPKDLDEDCPSENNN